MLNDLCLSSQIETLKSLLYCVYFPPWIKISDMKNNEYYFAYDRASTYFLLNGKNTGISWPLNSIFLIELSKM